MSEQIPKEQAVEAAKRRKLYRELSPAPAAYGEQCLLQPPPPDGWAKSIARDLFGSVAKWFEDGEDERDSEEIMNSVAAELSRLRQGAGGVEIREAAKAVCDEFASLCRELPHDPKKYSIGPPILKLAGLLAAEPAVLGAGSDDHLPVTFDEFAGMRGAVTRIAKQTTEDTVELDSTLVFDRHGTLTICNGKVHKPTHGQLRTIMAALGITTPPTKGESDA